MSEGNSGRHEALEEMDKEDREREETLKEMLENYDGPGVAEYASQGSGENRSSVRISNSAVPPEDR